MTSCGQTEVMKTGGGHVIMLVLIITYVCIYASPVRLTEVRMRTSKMAVLSFEFGDCSRRCSDVLQETTKPRPVADADFATSSLWNEAVAAVR